MGLGAAIGAFEYGFYLVMVMISRISIIEGRFLLSTLDWDLEMAFMKDGEKSKVWLLEDKLTLYTYTPRPVFDFRPFTNRSAPL